MDDGDGEGDSRTFRVNFSAEGLASLRGTVKEKLKEFLGDYTDDTLAEYVIVLLRNGRRKEEARKELGVFLEKDSVPFVSWLWDHLSSNLHLYLPPKENSIDGDNSLTPTLDVKSGRSNDKLERVSSGIKSDSENGRKKAVKESSNRRNREWRGLVQDETDSLHQSTTVENALQAKSARGHSPIRRSRSPRPLVHEKRRRQDEQQTMKQDLNAKPVLGAPSRLLQFAVRDAVKTTQQSATRSESTSTRSEPALKRLRSVVSTSTIDSAPDEVHQRTRAATRLAGGMATAVRAAAEAANDTTRSRSSRNVFSRLGHAVDDSLVHKESPGTEANRKYSEQNLSLTGHDYLERNEHDEESAVEMMGINEQARTASGSGSDNENYSNVEISERMTIDGSRAHSVSFVHQGNDTLMGQHNVAPKTEEVARKSRIKDQHPPVAAASNASHKVVNASVNLNTWKLPHNHSQRSSMMVDSQIREEKMEAGQHNMSVQLPTGSNSNSLKNVEETACANGEKGIPKSMTSTTGSYSTARPSEDADSRTIFVSNVHFAATKDTLSRHFNKFGEVLKVIIVTDAATGQPIGSAYVEFLRNESAELALSLNGTSFMSRILKVVLRSSAHHEAAAMSPWSRGGTWGQPFPARAGGRYPFSRAAATFGGAFGRRLPIKAGARSLQWKRESSSPAADGAKILQNSPLPGSGGGGGGVLLSPTARSLTYVRSKPKPDEASA